MTNQPPLNPDALASMARIHFESGRTDHRKWEHLYPEIQDTLIAEMRPYAEAVLAVAQPVVNSDRSTLEHFINQRPEYITALKNTRGTDDQSDYHRWQGHAESRRQLATLLGWTVPHESGETTRPEVKP